MTTPRMIMISEDFCGHLLTMTNLDNDELQMVLDRATQNDEDGIGMTLNEIVADIWGEDEEEYIIEIGSSEESDYEDIGELDREAVCWSNYLTASVICGLTEK